MARKKPLLVYSGSVETLQVQDRLDLGRLNLGPMTQLTVAANAITVTGSVHSVFSAAPPNPVQLTTINGGIDGDVIILRGVDNAHTRFMDNTGNLRLSGNFDFTAATDFIVLYCDGTNWNQLAASNNG